jgi:adenylylsulfate kinase
MMKIELDYRALAKALTWRGLASFITIVVAFAFTGSVVLSLGIGTLEAALKVVVYYLHERLWRHVRINGGDEG